MLLADPFEKSINKCLEYYGLDPSHYFSRPGLSWDAMIKMTGIELELILDIDMHLLIEKGIFFVYLGFFSQPFTIHRTAGEGEGIYLTTLYYFDPLHRHLDIS